MSWFFGPDDPGWELLPSELQTRVSIHYLRYEVDDLEDTPLVIRFQDESGNEWVI